MPHTINWRLIYSDDFTVDQTTFAAMYSLSGTGSPAVPTIGPTNGPTGGPGVLIPGPGTNPAFSLQDSGAFVPNTAVLPSPQQGPFRVTGIWKLLNTTGQPMLIFNGFESNTIFTLWDQPAGRSTIEVQTNGTPNFVVIQNPIEFGVPHAFDIRGLLSTMLNPSTPNSDGWIEVWMDGVLIQEIDNTTIWFGIHTPDGWGSLGIHPMGNFGSLRVYNEGPATPTTPPTTLVNSVPSCCPPDVKAAQAAVATLMQGPFWTPSCPGGAVVPSAADIVLAERWDY